MCQVSSYSDQGYIPTHPDTHPHTNPGTHTHTYKHITHTPWQTHRNIGAALLGSRRRYQVSKIRHQNLRPLTVSNGCCSLHPSPLPNLRIFFLCYLCFCYFVLMLFCDLDFFLVIFVLSRATVDVHKHAGRAIPLKSWCFWTQLLNVVHLTDGRVIQRCPPSCPRFQLYRHRVMVGVRVRFSVKFRNPHYCISDKWTLGQLTMNQFNGRLYDYYFNRWLLSSRFNKPHHLSLVGRRKVAWLIGS